jgi:hypothetical protein
MAQKKNRLWLNISFLHVQSQIFCGGATSDLIDNLCDESPMNSRLRSYLSQMGMICSGHSDRTELDRTPRRVRYQFRDSNVTARPQHDEKEVQRELPPDHVEPLLVKKKTL